MTLRPIALAVLLARVAPIAFTATPLTTLVLVSTPLALTACAGQTPAQKLMATRGAATIVVRDINLAVQAGKISQKENKEILNPLVHQADAIFDQWDAAVKAGKPGVDYAALAQGILNSIQQYLIAKEAAK